jgi:hypothetical protein
MADIQQEKMFAEFAKMRKDLEKSIRDSKKSYVADSKINILDFALKH